MSKEILTKAIEKAVEGGFDQDLGKATIEWLQKDILDFSTPEGRAAVTGFIFNHDFAKALWGDEPFAMVHWPHPDYAFGKGVELVATPYWQYHLQQMVIADDPIKYLGEHL